MGLCVWCFVSVELCVCAVVCLWGWVCGAVHCLCGCVSVGSEMLCFVWVTVCVCGAVGCLCLCVCRFVCGTWGCGALSLCGCGALCPSGSGCVAVCCGCLSVMLSLGCDFCMHVHASVFCGFLWLCHPLRAVSHPKQKCYQQQQIRKQI